MHMVITILNVCPYMYMYPCMLSQIGRYAHA